MAISMPRETTSQPITENPLLNSDIKAKLTANMDSVSLRKSGSIFASTNGNTYTTKSHKSVSVDL